MADFGEFWLVAAPCPMSKDEAFRTLMHNAGEFATATRFNVPDLKVGTLDALVQLSEELQKHEMFADSVVRKLAQLVSDLLAETPDAEQVPNGASEKLSENLVIGDKDPAAYLKNFNWDTARYLTKSSIPELTDTLTKHLSQIENGMKGKTSAYNQLRGNLQALERKATGNLLVRSLTDVVKKEHFVLDSEYLTTLLVVVPKASFREWESSYERITDMVVPRSSKMIAEDSEYGLFTVTVFQKIASDYKVSARERRFVVRDFAFDEASVEQGKKDRTNLETERKRQWGAMIRWGKVNFSEAFTAYAHLKAVRLFVESVLRYGLPVNFQGVLLQINKKTEKKLVDVLYRIYGYLDKSATKNDETVEVPGMHSHNQEKFHPWVMVQLGLNLLDK
ncbi:vacuolar ATPase subunit C [Capsaspora owczarzaki ATCC 30864]|uniref:V-type proton ATPase subunit C n=1 Tax=Capsaspora owczarzaki (strain ATCC 30864) TaxID=595528 RepID=A0A0D2WNT4_CAPO3|nr:vacuolar ATPase subunit C [Capsaspora owczarzaki ATCC 30864]KJE92098.1 vacuolar ATPase subunit C [Capsaspora owczarzaki ATCC 30864]|eukprot:XP_004363960.1 vacuolar ATPase subunit C [Capsaspora owczarzaki ATCC 30864]